MKNHYTNPQMGIEPIRNLTILCSSGDRVASNVNIRGGDRGGNVTTAF